MKMFGSTKTSFFFFFRRIPEKTKKEKNISVLGGWGVWWLFVIANNPMANNGKR